jgi:glycerate 2-kinase
MARVLLAPDKFKGTLSGAEVAASLAEGIRSRRPTADVVAVPVADGGDGSLAELAGLAGLHGALAPLTATSRGLGEAISHALDAGCTRVLIGIGGSASTDGGLGLVQALGARVRDASGAEVGPGGAGAATAASLDLGGLHPRLAAARIEVACDVDNPLTGPEGAAAVYGPQKGAEPAQVRQLDTALARWADIVAATTGHDHRADPGAGAAGGIGFAVVAILGARLRAGAQLMLDGPRLQAAGFDRVYTLLDEAATPQQALDEAASLLRRIGARLGDRLPDA